MQDRRRWTPLGLSLGILLGSVACQSQLYGEGILYLWNGTKKALEVRADGRTSLVVTLQPQTGALYEPIISGPYAFVAVKEGTATAPVPGEVVKERLTVFNVDGRGCFARADVSGMYKRKKTPVNVLKLHWDEEVIQVDNEIHVLPGEDLPFAAPRTVYAFQRFVVVPCHLAKQREMAEEDVANFIRRIKPTK